MRLGPVALGTGASVLNSLIIATLFARLAGPAPYGVYQIALAAATLVGVVALSGSATAAMRAAAQGRAAAWPLFRARLPYCVAGAAVLGATALVFSARGNGGLAAALLAAAVTLPGFLGGDVYPAHLLGARQYWSYFRFQLLAQTATVLGVLPVLIAAPKEPWAAVLVVGGLTGLVQLGGLLRFRRIATADAGDFAYARKLTGVSVLSAVDARLDILLTGALLGAREAGFVAVARTFPTLAKRAWEVIYPAFFAKFAAVSPTEGVSLAGRYRPPLILVFGAGTVLAVGLAPIVMPAVFGSRFDPSVTLSQLLLLAAGLNVAGYLHGVLLTAWGDVRRIAAVYIVMPVTSLLALPPLMIAFGINGIGFEALLAALIYIWLTPYLARRSARAELT